MPGGAWRVRAALKPVLANWPNGASLDIQPEVAAPAATKAPLLSNATATIISLVGIEVSAHGLIVRDGPDVRSDLADSIDEGTDVGTKWGLGGAHVLTIITWSFGARLVVMNRTAASLSIGPRSGRGGVLAFPTPPSVRGVKFCTEKEDGLSLSVVLDLEVVAGESGNGAEVRLAAHDRDFDDSNLGADRDVRKDVWCHAGADLVRRDRLRYRQTG